MKRVIDSIEALGIVNSPSGSRELCVEADAQYDESSSELVVRLDAFLRNLDLRTRETHTREDWMPHPETLREHVDEDECGAMAREIFQGWVKKVRKAAPSLSDHSNEESF